MRDQNHCYKKEESFWWTQRKEFLSLKYLNRNCQTIQKKQYILDFCSSGFSISLPLSLANPLEVGLPSWGFTAFFAKASNEASLFLQLRLDNNLSENLLNSNSIPKHAGTHWQKLLLFRHSWIYFCSLTQGNCMKCQLFNFYFKTRSSFQHL